MTLQEDDSLVPTTASQLTGTESTKKFSKEAAEELYAFGYGFYENGKYDTAIHFFRLLTLIDPEMKKYWMGLGASYQMLKEDQHAVQCYGVAALIDKNDPYAHFHAAEALFSLGNRQLGNEALEAAETIAASQFGQDDTLLSRIVLMKETHAEQKDVKNDG